MCVGELLNCVMVVFPSFILLFILPSTLPLFFPFICLPASLKDNSVHSFFYSFIKILLCFFINFLNASSRPPTKHQHTHLPTLNTHTHQLPTHPPTLNTPTHQPSTHPPTNSQHIHQLLTHPPTNPQQTHPPTTNRPTH